MKTYIITSDTNYGLLVHIVNAESAKAAIQAATNDPKNIPPWPHCWVFEVDTKTPGVVFVE